MVDDKQALELNDSDTYNRIFTYLLDKTKSWEGKGIDREHIAAISIFRALRKFDATRKCSFKCFALTIMLNKLRDSAKRIKIESKYYVSLREEIDDTVRQGRFAEVIQEP